MCVCVPIYICIGVCVFMFACLCIKHFDSHCDEISCSYVTFTLNTDNGRLYAPWHADKFS